MRRGGGAALLLAAAWSLAACGQDAPAGHPDDAGDLSEACRQAMEQAMEQGTPDEDGNVAFGCLEGAPYDELPGDVLVPTDLPPGVEPTPGD